jgi:hypothetical protein
MPNNLELSLMKTIAKSDRLNQIKINLQMTFNILFQHYIFPVVCSIIVLLAFILQLHNFFCQDAYHFQLRHNQSEIDAALFQYLCQANNRLL